ncbi:hypothetical protein EV363DRAFT_1158226, partial [Boletus edulis]
VIDRSTRDLIDPCTLIVPYYRISDIFDYVIAGRTSLPPLASPPSNTTAGPSTFPDIFQLVPEEAVHSDSYNPNDYNPSDYQVQIKEEENLQESDQLADYCSSLDQGYRTLVNKTTLAPEDTPSTLVRATTVDTNSLPGQIEHRHTAYTEDCLTPTLADLEIIYPPLGSPTYNPSTPLCAPSELLEPIDWEPIYSKLTQRSAHCKVNNRGTIPKEQADGSVRV